MRYATKLWWDNQAKDLRKFVPRTNCFMSGMSRKSIYMLKRLMEKHVRKGLHMVFIDLEKACPQVGNVVVFRKETSD